ncbi:MAG: glycerol-3-phosphate acyltransferase [Dehalococcoidales bacterium]|jgi:glycerol-3-phosphate acyltransferase PlsY|nr:glycerol-3-phosphate acyltransferase [Dehalococcoidales bacterium]MDX9986284.1 glycerol-3-phosphate acyltransferase [Dehalococcoidales bacterium]NLE90819.1 hypothetical protein [Dehalococcoidales bacterium]
MLSWQFVLLGLFAYLLGSVPAAYIAARLSKGIDLRETGSGNVGTSNVARMTSKILAVPVFMFDIGKGYLVVWLASIAGMELFYQIVIGLLAVIGHNWPVFLGFKGGRGIATSLGMVLAVSPWLGVIMIVLAFSLFPFKHLALGVLIALTALPLLAWFVASPLGISDRTGAFFGFLLLFIIVVIRRLTPPRSEISLHTPIGELLVNRLLFDRDIRSREAWVNRNS